MTDLAAAPRPSSGLAALLRHSRYVIAENRVTGFAFGLFLLIVLAAVVGPYIVPHDPLASDTVAALKPPSLKHWFGTDQIGRDVFSRVIVATRLDFFIAVASVALVFLMGGLAGVAAGFFGGWTDRVVGRVADTIMAFPLFLLAQILPNIMPIMIVQMSLTMGYAILNAAGLSFIGLGVRPPTAEWGIMVAEGAAFMVSGEWWIALFPGAALMIAVFCFNLLGDGLRDIVDPQRRT